ncbi:MAG: alpha/beta fold hydrolase [Bacillota bacterium]
MPELSLTDFTLHYTDETTGGVAKPTGPTLVLVHGDLGSTAWWRPFINRLPAGWRVIAPDLRGCGRSSRPVSGYRIERYAADLKALLEATKPGPYGLVGHSLGGAVAQTFALDRPAGLEALVLVDPVPAEGLRIGHAGKELFAHLKENLEALTVAVGRALTTAPRDDFFRLLVADAAAADQHVYVDNAAEMDTFNVAGRLHEVGLRTLVVIGEKDQLIPKVPMVRTAEFIPQARVAFIADCGHSPQIEKPDEFVRLVTGFIDEVRRAAELPTEPRSMADFAVGQKAVYRRIIAIEDIETFGRLIGDYNPLHFDQAYAEKTRFGGRIGHGMLTASLISTALGMKLPGPGGVYLRQDAKFLKPVNAGDTVNVVVEVTAVNVERRRLTLRTECFNQRDEEILAGEAEALIT